MTTWPVVALGEICKIVGGGTPKRTNPDYYGTDIPWVTPKDMKRWEISEAQIGLTHLGLENSAARLVPEGSVLIVVRSGVLKHTLPVGLSRVPVAINQDMKALLCNSDVEPDYLARYIKWKSPEILQWVRATTADNFSIDKLKQLEVPLPSILEQRRIVSILDRADEIRASRREALRQLDELTQSIFLDMFGDPLTNPKGWPTCTISDVASIIVPSRDKPTDFGGEIPWVTLPDVKDVEIFEAKKRVSVDNLKVLANRLIPEGSVLLSCAGSLGRIAINRVPVFVNQQFYGLVPKDSGDTAVFLATHLRSKGVRFFEALAGTSTIAFFSKQRALDIEIIWPPKELRRCFEEHFLSVQQLRMQHRTALTELDSLFASLQSRAFRSELDRR